MRQICFLRFVYYALDQDPGQIRKYPVMKMSYHFQAYQNHRENKRFSILHSVLLSAAKHFILPDKCVIPQLFCDFLWCLSVYVPHHTGTKKVQNFMWNIKKKNPGMVIKTTGDKTGLENIREGPLSCFSVFHINIFSLGFWPFQILCC